MATATYSTAHYPTFATLKRAHPEVKWAFSEAGCWFATIHAPLVIGYKPLQQRAMIPAKQEKPLRTRRRQRRHKRERNKA